MNHICQGLNHIAKNSGGEGATLLCPIENIKGFGVVGKSTVPEWQIA